MKNGIYCIVIAFLVTWVIQDFDLCKLQDLWRHNADQRWCNITEYGISVQKLSPEGWYFAEVYALQELPIAIVVMMSP